MAKGKPPRVMIVTAETTLEETQKWTLNNTDGEGCLCPNCVQLLVERKRRITRAMALAMAGMVRYFDNHDKTYVRAANVLYNTYQWPLEIGGALAKLRYWDLIAPSAKREASYKVLPLGHSFVKYNAKVPSFHMIFRREVVFTSAESTTISDILGKNWDYKKWCKEADKFENHKKNS